MTTVEKEIFKEALGVISSNLRRISYFGASAQWEKNQPLINKFLDDSQSNLTKIDTLDRTNINEHFLSMRYDFNEIKKQSRHLSVNNRLIFAEEASTLSLRLFHLSKAL